jgi:hypothetical protein
MNLPNVKKNPFEKKGMVGINEGTFGDGTLSMEPCMLRAKMRVKVRELCKQEN